MWKKVFAILVSTAVVASAGTGVYVSAAPDTSAPPQPAVEVAKMYRVKHELKLDIRGSGAELDGKPIAADKPILRSGRVFVPIRTLELTGSAEVKWSLARREVTVHVDERIVPPLNGLRFSVGSEQVLLPDGTAITDTKIPAPFLTNGRVYIPLTAMKMLGMNVAMLDGAVLCNWSVKIIELLQPGLATDKAETTFTMLYQQDMYPPQILYSIGSSGWAGSGGKITDKNISLDGRVYNRMAFTVTLRPGINPFELFAISGGVKRFDITRKVADPADVPVTVVEREGGPYVSFAEPASGYLRKSPGEAIPLAGEILAPNKPDKLVLDVQKYTDTGFVGYKGVKTVELPVKDGKFEGSFSLEEPGTYLVSVEGPGFTAIPGRNQGLIVWAEFIVEAASE